MNRIKKEQNEYEPILPNILDHTMIPEPVNEKEVLTGGGVAYPLGKKILIGSLVVIIIILVIILIYQLYHYFSDNTQTKNKPQVKNHSQPKKKTQTTPPPKKFIPDEIRNLDDDALKQFIKNPKQQQIAPRNLDTRKVQQQTLTESIVENAKNNFIEQKEVEQVDILEEKELTRGDMLKELKKEIDEDVDDGELAELEIDDSILVESIMKGCQHTLLSGKRKGEKCRNNITSGDRCNKHA